MDEQRVIRKYNLEFGNTSIDMPRGSTVLSVQTQSEKISLWILVNPESVIVESRLFEVYRTGEPIGFIPGRKREPIGFIPGRKREFLGTCQFHGGTFVCHVFERIT